MDSTVEHSSCESLDPTLKLRGMCAARETFEQRNHLLDHDIVDAFERDGFVVVDGLLTEDEIDHYHEAVTRVVRSSADNDTPLEQKNPYQQSYIQCINLWEESAE